jgi:hypothetical protein
MSTERTTLRQVLGAFYQTVDVMKSARVEDRTMDVWSSDIKAVEDVVSFLENLRDSAQTPAELEDLRKANQILHALIGNRDAQICELQQDLKEAESALGLAQTPAVQKADYKIGYWLSGALEDPAVCDQMKADIKAWFEAHQPGLDLLLSDTSTDREACICGVPGCHKHPPGER